MSRIAETLTPELFGYPTRPGYRDAGTSKAAATAISGAVEELRLRVLAELPGTAEEIAGKLGLRKDQVAPRLTELTKEIPPRAIKTKTRHRNAISGLSAAVYAKA